MPDNRPSARLTVYFDGQFWVGFFERHDGATTSIARHVFGPEPSLPQIAELVSGPAWSRLTFVPTDAIDNAMPSPAANPKRRQREAAREAHANAPSTKSQDALKHAIEELKIESAAAKYERRAAAVEERWQQRVAKRKDKRRGH